MSRVPHTSESQPGSSASHHRVRLVVAALLVAGCLFALRDQIDFAGIIDRIRGWGPWAPVLYMLTYILACLLLLPASPLTLAAGAVFGVVAGSIYVSIASTLGAAAAFLAARFLGRASVERRLTTWPAFRAIQDATAQEGWKIVLLTRLSPLFPFNLLNLGFGVTRVPLSHFVAASWVGMLPATIWYVYLGSLAGSLLTQPRAKSPVEWLLLGVGLIATAVVTFYVTRLARRALDRRLPHPETVTPTPSTET
ncbi:MAG: TVP38/TMEM64 family protein [Verrucomicrobiales bacterium]|nr:TVP38/TMEM64 family protein [Verrucomicrobiales bacterium]